MRRTPAPDMAACAALLFGSAFVFGLLSAIYSTKDTTVALKGVAIHGGLLTLSAVIAHGLFLRRPYALGLASAAFAAALLASFSEGVYSETAQLPAGLLALFSLLLLGFTRREFAP